MIKSVIRKSKLKQMAFLSLKNSIRLHIDSIILYKIKSFPSSLQLSVLALEELGKSQELDYYSFFIETNDGFIPFQEEENYFKMYYSHLWKQGAALKRNFFHHNEKFIEAIDNKELELKKQLSTYVGLPFVKGKIDFTSKIQSPFSIKGKEARNQISLVNDLLIQIGNLILKNDEFFDNSKMNDMLNKSLIKTLKSKWPYKSSIK